MEYILAGVSGAGIAGVVALALYMAKMASNNRSDLHALVGSEKDLHDARRDIIGYRQSIEDRDDAIQSLQDQLTRERGANKQARAALDAAYEKLASRGDASSVAADIRGALTRLSEMSSLPGAAASEGGHGDR